VKRAGLQQKIRRLEKYEEEIKIRQEQIGKDVESSVSFFREAIDEPSRTDSDESFYG
jgi:hypothetical protein